MLLKVPTIHPNAQRVAARLHLPVEEVNATLVQHERDLDGLRSPIWHSIVAEHPGRAPFARDAVAGAGR
jgi:hypothetical protein